MNKSIATLLVFTCFTAAQAVVAQQTATFTMSARVPTAAEIGGDAALGVAGMMVNEFFVTTSSDILQFDMVDISIGPASLYQNGTGSDANPPNPAFVVAIPALGADSWITTPTNADNSNNGDTSLAGTGFGDPTSAWFDSDNDGPQTSFKFAQLTTTGTGLFNGRIFLQDPAAPVIIPFSLDVGGGDPNGGENTPPTVDDLFPGEVTFDQHTLATATTPASYQLQGTDAEDGDDANLDWALNTFTGPFAIDGVTPLPGTGNGAQALSSAGLFTWDPTGSALGFYFAGVTVTDSGGLMDTGILRVQVPEPGVLVLAGIGLIGIVASRRRLS
jgi:hypothetical protein